MHDKPITAAVYLIVGLLLAFGPILAQLRPFRSAPSVSGALPVFPGSWQVGCTIGLLLGFSLLWWRRVSDGITLPEAMRYAAIVSICLWFLNREVEAGPAAAPVSPATRWTLLAAGAVLAIIGTFGTGVLESSTFRLVAWHHWGAFTAPPRTCGAAAASSAISRRNTAWAPPPCWPRPAATPAGAACTSAPPGPISSWSRSGC